MTTHGRLDAARGAGVCRPVPRRRGRIAPIGRALLARAVMGGWALLPLMPVLAALLSWFAGAL